MHLGLFAWHPGLKPTRKPHEPCVWSRLSGRPKVSIMGRRVRMRNPFVRTYLSACVWGVCAGLRVHSRLAVQTAMCLVTLTALGSRSRLLFCLMGLVAFGHGAKAAVPKRRQSRVVPAILCVVKVVVGWPFVERQEVCRIPPRTQKRPALNAQERSAASERTGNRSPSALRRSPNSERTSRPRPRRYARA